MNLLTLTLAALCLVSGALAGQSTIKAEVKDGSVTLTCTPSNDNAGTTGFEFHRIKGNTDCVVTIDKNNLTDTEERAKEGTKTCKAKKKEGGVSDDDASTGIMVGSVKKPTLTDNLNATHVHLTCKTEGSANFLGFTVNDTEVIAKAGLTMSSTKDVVTISKEKVSEWEGSYRCKVGDVTKVVSYSDVVNINSSAPRLLTTSGLVLSLCVLVTNLL